MAFYAVRLPGTGINFSMAPGPGTRIPGSYMPDAGQVDRRRLRRIDMKPIINALGVCAFGLVVMIVTIMTIVHLPINIDDAQYSKQDIRDLIKENSRLRNDLMLTRMRFRPACKHCWHYTYEDQGSIHMCCWCRHTTTLNREQTSWWQDYHYRHTHGPCQYD